MKNKILKALNDECVHHYNDHSSFMKSHCTELETVMWLLEFKSEEDRRYVVFIIIVGKSLKFPTFVELTEAQFCGCRDIPHDHTCGVHWHHKVSGVFQCHGLFSKDIKDLRESKGEKFSYSPVIFMHKPTNKTDIIYLVLTSGPTLCNKVILHTDN